MTTIQARSELRHVISLCSMVGTMCIDGLDYALTLTHQTKIAAASLSFCSDTINGELPKEPLVINGSKIIFVLFLAAIEQSMFQHYLFKYCP